MLGFQLTQALLFRVHGRDATRYLHSRLTNDIRSLPPGSSCEVAGLNPQGKIEFFGGILRSGESEYYLLLDGGIPEAVEGAFRRYLVADRVEVQPCIGWSMIHVAEITAAPSTVLHGIARMRLDVPGVDLFAPALNELPAFEALSEADCFRRRARAGIPAYPQELAQDLLFSEAELPRAISRNKGCYVGQEVIERIYSLGKAPRLLRSFSATGGDEIKAGAPVRGILDGVEKQIGEIVSVGVAENEQFGFLLIRNAAAERIRSGSSDLTIKF